MTAEVNGWTIRADHTSAFVRGFIAEPVEAHEAEYATHERRSGRLIAATYPAHVTLVRIRWQWSEARNEWWWQATRTLHILNHRTGEPYRSGWRGEPIWQHLSGLDEAFAEYITALVDATNPRSVITVTEVPA